MDWVIEGNGLGGTQDWAVRTTFTSFLVPAPSSQGSQLLQSRTYGMHRCLQIQELLSIVFEYVHVPRKALEDDPLSASSLARLARTCKAFQDPALDILWHSQDSLAPLLKCLPRDAWAWKEGKFVSNSSNNQKLQS